MKSPGAVSNEESSLLRKRRVPGLLQLKGEHCLKASVGGTGKLCCWGYGVNVTVGQENGGCGLRKWMKVRGEVLGYWEVSCQHNVDLGEKVLLSL